MKRKCYGRTNIITLVMETRLMGPTGPIPISIGFAGQQPETATFIHFLFFRKYDNPFKE